MDISWLLTAKHLAFPWLTLLQSRQHFKAICWAS